MSNHSLLLFANNIHSGGANILLVSLLTSLDVNSCISRILVVCDNRYIPPASLTSKIVFYPINPSLPNRIFSYYSIYRISRYYDVCLCFGNLPPILKLDCKTILYLHNSLLVCSLLKLFSSRLKIIPRLLYERIHFAFFLRNADQVFVQSKTMFNIFKKAYPRFFNPVHLRPFIPYMHVSQSNSESLNLVPSKTKSHSFSFFYPASGEYHKNHLNLLIAWKILSSYGLNPCLYLTVSRIDYPKLFKQISDTSSSSDLNIVNLGSISRSDVLCYMQLSDALIYPSTTESFGMPLAESSLEKLPILSSDLDYVYDVSIPFDTFNSCSPLSIAHCVMRFLKHKPSPPFIMDTSDFISTLFHP